MRKQLRPVIVFIFVTTLGAGGLFLGMTTARSVLAVAEDRYNELQLFTKVLNIVQKYYVEKTDMRRLLEGGIKGMLKELDPHTNYMSPKIFKEFESETSGEFGGLGIEITVRKGILTIISPIEDTPAWRAGLKAGDQVVAVDGFATKGLSLVEAAQLMRGKIGESVELSIMREGFEESKVYKITRGKVKIKSVKFTDLNSGYGYIRITSFIENTGDDLKKVMKKYSKERREDIKGLIIDLRKNPGGLLDQAVAASDLFLHKGTIVSTIGRDEKQKDVMFAQENGTYRKFPMIVLIDEFSASASEILAGALQDNKRALIMGKRSFGKGSVQSVIKLGNGSGLKLTVARYYTPSGRSIQAEGIKPDIIVNAIDADTLEKAVLTEKVTREQDIAGHLEARENKKKGIEGKKKKSVAKMREEENIIYWRKKIRGKKKSEISGKEKLLSEDYQVLQAYNYLKAWSVMKTF